MAFGIEPLTRWLNTHAGLHKDVGKRLTDSEILDAEARLGLKLPTSYRSFLTQFGDGAYWLYGCQSVSSLRGNACEHPAPWLKEILPDAPDPVPVVGEGTVPLASLLCLMSEDSNGGSWCWLTSQASAEGEWPLAYYERFEKKLFYKIPTFCDWLELLITHREEVIRVLDVEEKLGLG
jgi:SMI1-KNR4 cell-wall